MDIKHLPVFPTPGDYRTDIIFVNGKYQEMFSLKFYGQRRVCS
jgi:hypothetical protein